MSRLLAVALLIASMTALPGQAAETATTETDEQKAAMKALDADIARLDVLLEKIPEAPLKATTKGFIDGFKEKRNALGKSYDQTKYDELKFETVAEFQRLNLWLKPPRARPSDTSTPASVVFALEPSPTDRAEVAAAMAAADDEIARLAERVGRLPAGAARESGTQRLRVIKENRTALGPAFTVAGWNSLIAAMKAGIDPR